MGEQNTDLRARVEQVIDEQVRPGLRMDGGDIELVDIEDGIALVKLQGACHGCPAASQTLQFGVQNILQCAIPEIKGVRGV